MMRMPDVVEYPETLAHQTEGVKAVRVAAAGSGLAGAPPEALTLMCLNALLWRGS